jgi:hypothetical protein
MCHDEWRTTVNGSRSKAQKCRLPRSWDHPVAGADSALVKLYCRGSWSGSIPASSRAGQARAVAAGPLDPDQADRPEPAQPAQQPGIAGCRGRELPDTEQPADRVQRGSDVHAGMSVHPAGDGACLYNGHSHPFHRLRDGTHPLAVGPVKPWPLIQARQIRPAAPVGARKTGTRPTDRFARQPERRQPIRRSGRDPGSRLYAPITSGSGKPRQKHYSHSPCRIGAAESFAGRPGGRAQIIQLGRRHAGEPHGGLARHCELSAGLVYPAVCPWVTGVGLVRLLSCETCPGRSQANWVIRSPALWRGRR